MSRDSSSGLDIRDARMELAGRTIIHGVDLAAPSGGVTALVGPNGAGKTTLLRGVAGLLPVAAGTVSFGGDDLLALSRRARARIVAVVEQELSSETSLSVHDAVELGLTPHRSLLSASTDDDGATVMDALSTVGMDGFADRQFDSLSGGEKQRVHLARALAQRPRLMLLDEPTNHLDIRAQLSTLALLRRLARGSVTVVAALHDLTLAATYADHVVVLAAGRIVAAGPPGEVLTASVIHDVYGVQATVLQHPSTGRPVIAFAPEEDAL